jgi:hypothetical protein
MKKPRFPRPKEGRINPEENMYGAPGNPFIHSI